MSDLFWCQVSLEYAHTVPVILRTRRGEKIKRCHPSKFGTGNGTSIVTAKKYFTVLGFFHARPTQHRLKIFILREKFLHEFLSPTLPSNHAP